MNWFVELLDDLLNEGGECTPEKLTELRDARARLAAEVSLPPRSMETDRLVSAIDEAETVDQLAAIFDRMPREYGFDDATIMVLREGTAYLSHRVMSTLPDGWWQDYRDLNLAENDPVVDAVMSRSHEVFMDELMTEDDTRIRYLKAAEARHIGCNGVVFKIAYDSGLVAAMVLNSVRPPDYVRRQYRKFRSDLNTIAHSVCDALVHFSRVGAVEAARLTTDEVRFLRLLAVSENPSAALNMVCRYGSAKSVQNQIVRKLGVKSIFQAVLIASRQGLLDTAIIDGNEIIPTYPRITGWDLLDGDTQQPEEGKDGRKSVA